jgi:hypothetical protein
MTFNIPLPIRIDPEQTTCQLKSGNDKHPQISVRCGASARMTAVASLFSQSIQDIRDIRDLSPLSMAEKNV